MKEYLHILKKSKLFKDITEDDIVKALKCLKAVTRKFSRDDTIYLEGDTVTKIGIVLSGSVLITKDDIMGNRNILTSLSPSELFGETFVCSNVKQIPVTVVALTNCEILFLDYNEITEVCHSSCNYHNKLIKNMLNIIANKNLLLNNKLDILSAKTTKDKLMAYFNIQVKQNKSNIFTIPFNRDALADYLNLNRSSMSRELSKMSKEGILRFSKNKFEILI